MPSGLRKGDEILPFELLQQVLESLVRERQQLRLAGVSDERLEANRLAIVNWQLELTRALAAGLRPSGNGGQWQTPEPESVNSLPGSGTNFHA